MVDFTLNAYATYLGAIKSAYNNILRMDEFIPLEKKPTSFCLIRHDVDRKPGFALRMAILEKELGIRSTYYFRAKKGIFHPKIMKSISDCGHEVGYHYESLSDTDGDISAAIDDFSKNLSVFRAIVPVKTVSMHGRPFKKQDNRDMWRSRENHKLLAEKFNLSGEVYLDIDYSEIAYINDTGRNWTSSQSNLRDKVDSGINADMKNGRELLDALHRKRFPKIVFQIHPERWTRGLPEWTIQRITDILINIAKFCINVVRKKGNA